MRKRLVMLWVCGVLATPVMASDNETTMSLEQIEIPDSHLTDQHGNSLSFVKDIARQSRLVIAFQFTGCLQQCPVTTAILGGVDTLVEADRYKDVRLLSITLDPLSDSPEQLLKKATEMNASKKWLWLTSDFETLDVIYRRFGAGVGPKENHNAFILVGNGTTGQFVRISGIPAPESILTEIDKIVR